MIALVFAHWGLTTKDALDRGIFNFDSLWYHMPFAVGHGAEPLGDRDAPHRDGLHQLVLPAELGAAARRRDPAHRARHALAVPQLRLAGGRLPRRLVHRPALRARATSASSPRRSSLECHTLVVREPGAAKNDLVAAALLLAAIAILVNAWALATPMSERGAAHARCRSAGRSRPPGSRSGWRSGPR